MGGSSLALDAGNGSRASETAWAGSGGGASIHFARPSWQNVAGDDAARARRLRAGGTRAGGAYVVFGRGARRCTAARVGERRSGRGICALINQGRAQAGKPPAGLLNPSLYPLAGSANFYDVTVGQQRWRAAQSGGKYRRRRRVRPG